MAFRCIECGKNLVESSFFYEKVKNKYKDCLIKKLNCQEYCKFLTKKWLASHMEREHQPSESRSQIDNVYKKLILTAKQKQDNNPNVFTYENHAYVVIIGPRNVGKTYSKLQTLAKVGNNRSRQIITRSPNQ